MHHHNGASGDHRSGERQYSGPEAALLAGISYRQLDYWARRGWIVPSQDGEDVTRRCYDGADVVRLAALGHLGRSRVDVAAYAEATGQLPVPSGSNFVVVWGIHDASVRLVPAPDVRRVASEPGRYVMFDPAPLVRRMENQEDGNGGRRRRRTFTPEYKLRVLSQYDELTMPGAKGALLQAEGLHTSHLVAWRRSRDTGELGLPPPTAGHGSRAMYEHGSRRA